MARNEEFERRLVDHPDDRETWTVYADWLESQGDPRGQLIALELRYEQSTGDPKLGALVSAVHARVMRPLVGALEARTDETIRCRRGFIDGVSLGQRPMAAPLATILRELLDHPLSGLMSSLSLRDDRDGASAIALLGERAPRSLRNLSLELGVLPSLEPLHSLVKLERLACSETRDGSPALRAIADAPWPLRNLRISLRAEAAPTDTMSCLLRRDDLQLEELYISVAGRDRAPEQQLAGAIARALVESPSAASLTRLHIGAPLVRADYYMLVERKQRFPKLRDVHLPSRTFTSRMLATP